MADFFLTDEFVEFSKKIADLHERKKAAHAEFMPIYDAFKKQIAEFEEELKTLTTGWENWKSLNEPKTAAKSITKTKDE